MLVLSRKATERIHIGDNITVEVRRVAGNRVTLAIEAPRDIRILRGELEKIAKEFEDAPVVEEPAAQPSAAQVADEQPASKSPTESFEVQPYVVHQGKIRLTDALPPSDLSGTGMNAYAVG